MDVRGPRGAPVRDRSFRPHSPVLAEKRLRQSPRTPETSQAFRRLGQPKSLPKDDTSDQRAATALTRTLGQKSQSLGKWAHLRAAGASGIFLPSWVCGGGLACLVQSLVERGEGGAAWRDRKGTPGEGV